MWVDYFIMIFMVTAVILGSIYHTIKLFVQCFPGHDWSKWDAYQIEVTRRNFDRTVKWNCFQLRQRRMCNKCGKTQDKVVIE